MFKKDTPAKPAADGSTPESWGRNTTMIPLKYYDSIFKNPALRDARAYILPANQADFATATRFINALIRTGIIVHQANADFSHEGKTYPKGSYIVKTDQSFRPHVLDMFEPQDHPNDFQYPGGPPVPPYDAAGWTLAYQMGVDFDRTLNDVTGSFERLSIGEVLPLKGNIKADAAKAGYLLNAANNHSFTVVNELLKNNVAVYRTSSEINGNSKGSFFVPMTAKSKEWITKNAAQLGADATGIDSKPTGLQQISKARIALWDTYGGSMPSGWMRWIMEQYHFDAEVVYAQDIDKGNLKSKYDVIIFVGGAMPPLTGAPRSMSPKPEDIPEEFRKTIGNLTKEKSIPALQAFLEEGGQVVTIGSSTSLAYHLNLPVRDALTEIANGKERNLPNEKFYIPGSLMQVTIDKDAKAAWGMKTNADVYFDDSPVFSINPDAQTKGTVKPIAWFASDKTLRSGWAWGQSYLKDGVAAFSATVGKGTLLAFGPEITFRAQTHGTFKLVFNQLYK